MRLTHVHHGPLLGWYLVGWQRHPKIFIRMADALALSHSQDQATAQMLLSAKLLFNISYTSGASAEDKTYNIGNFNIAILLIENVHLAYTNSNPQTLFTRDGHPIYLVPSMNPFAFTLLASNGSNFSSSYLTNTSYPGGIRIETTQSAVIFKLSMTGSARVNAMNGILAILS